MPNDQMLSMRIPSEWLTRVDALVDVAAKDPANAAWRVSRAALLRLAMFEGVKSLERRYGVRPSARRVRRTTARGGAQ